MENELGRKKVYVNTLIESAPINRPRNRKLLSESKRSLTLKYYLKVQGKNMRVCRKFFLNTLDVGAKAVHNWLKKPSISKTSSNKNTPKKGYLTNERQCLIHFLMPFHQWNRITVVLIRKKISVARMAHKKGALRFLCQ